MMNKYIYHPIAAPAFFLLIQLFMYIFQPIAWGEDFLNVYWPNAHNLLGDGHPFEALGHHFQANGLANRFGTMPPLYSWVLSMIIQFGGNIHTAFWVNALILAATLIILRWLSGVIFNNQKYAAAVVYISALHPLFAAMPATMGSEVLFTFFLISSIYFFVRFVQDKQTIYLFCFACAWILATETRLMSLYILPIMIIVTWFHIKEFSKKIKYSLGLFAIFICVRLQFSDPTYQYYLHRTMIDGLSRYPLSDAAKELITGMSPVLSDYLSHFFTTSIQTIIHQPISWVSLYIQKLTAAWYVTDSGQQTIYLMIIQIPLLLTTLYQTILSILRREKNQYILLFILAIIYFNFTAAATLSICRYMAPVMPLVVMVVVWGVGRKN